MKLNQLFAFIVLAVAATGCHNSQTRADETTTAAAAVETPSQASGEAVFTATIDGQTVTSSASAGQFNIAQNQIADDKQPYLLFNLGDIKSADDQTTTRNFRVIVVKKQGAVHLTKEVEIPDYGIALSYNTKPFPQYWAKDIQLEVTSVSATRLKGKFSGVMYLSNDTRDVNKAEVTVNVQFDIPVSPDPAP